jgi:hypothetical protein
MTNHDRTRELEREIIAQQEALLEKTKVLGQELKAEIKGTVGRVVDTVENGVSTVSESLDTNIKGVAERVHHSMDRVRTTLDVPARVEATPFKMLGVAALVGGAFGLMSARRGEAQAPTAAPRSSGPSVSGPVALLGLGFTFLRPYLLNAAQEFVMRKFSGGADRGDEVPSGGVESRGRGGYNRGHFIHHY